MRALVGPCLLLVSFSCASADLANVGSLAQDEFRKLSEDLGAVAAYKGVTPAGSLGPLGVDVGLELTDTRLDRSDLFRRAGSAESRLVIPKVHVSKGLMGGLDVGAFIGGVPELDAYLYGANLKWTAIEDSLARPAVALRLSATATQGLDPIDLKTAAVDLMVSKKFALITPYAGLGLVRVRSIAGVGGLADENFNQSRAFGGVNLNLALVNMAVEVEKMGGATSLSAKVGWRF